MFKWLRRRREKARGVADDADGTVVRSGDWIELPSDPDPIGAPPPASP